jgi:hypothetical protein
MIQKQRAARAAAECIRLLNDEFRRGLGHGSLVLTIGVIARGRAFQKQALAAMLAYEGFTPDNDPYGEHDFGSLEVIGVRVIFKIDYNNTTLDAHSPDAADASVTHRVLTLMLADEY